MQVKSREGPIGTEERERRWLSKKATEGLRQADGTVRRLGLETTELTNLRGQALAIDLDRYRWLDVVIVDHPACPADTVPDLSVAKRPSVVLLRRDWEFLFDQLKSTTAVAQYIERVAGEPHELGLEPARYYDLAQADAEASPEGFSFELLAGGKAVPAPLLPLAPTGTDDLKALRLLRTLMEEVAVTKLARASEADRLRLLAELDRLPVAHRAQIGRRVLECMAHVVEDVKSPGLLWRMSSVRSSDGRIHLGFGTCSQPYTNPNVPLGLQGWAQLRHFDVLEATGGAAVDDLTTVAVIVTPRLDGQRPWDTSVTAVSGPVKFDAADLRILRELFPGFGDVTGRAATGGSGAHRPRHSPRAHRD